MGLVFKQSAIYQGFLSSAELATLINGLRPSGCPLPCSIVSTEVQLESESEERVGFQLYFHQTVQVMFVICQRYVFSEEMKIANMPLLRCSVYLQRKILTTISGDLN